MNRTAQQQLMQELKQADNVQEAFEILNEYYDLENCRPGTITRNIFLEKLVQGMASLGAKARPKYK